MLLTVGQLAGRTGLTVRALHHYDAIGLLVPSGRSDSGYRLYNRDDVMRLYRIQGLQRLGLSLAEIGTVLARGADSLPQLIEQHLEGLQRQIAQATALRDRLGRLREQLLQGDQPDLADWLITLELMNVYDKYLTADELSEIRNRKDAVQAEWPPLIAAMRNAMEQRIPPSAPEVQALAAQWISLLDRTLGENARLQMKWDEMYRKEPALQDQSGIDMALLNYLYRAIGHSRLARYARHLAPEDVRRLRPEGQRQREWPALIAGLTRLVATGAPPVGAEAQALLQTWDALVDDFTGDDAELREKVLSVAKLEPDLKLGITSEMREFLERARATNTGSAAEPRRSTS